MLIAFYIVIGLVLLYYGGEFLVKGGVSIARRCGVSPLVVGLTLVAYATSAPELLVSIMAALSGNPNISIGNVVGSNICNIGLILGLSAAIYPLSVERRLLTFDMPLLIATTAAFTVIGVLFNGVPRWAGIVFLSGCVAYTVFTVMQAKRSTPPEKQDEETESEEKVHSWSVATGLVLLGVAMLIGGSHALVKGAVMLAGLLGISDVVIGLTVVAVGTSMPELATSAVAAFRKQSDIAIGNIVGSCLFNILCIMGIAPIIKPLERISVSLTDWGVFLGLTAVLFPIMLTGKRISRVEGVFLLLVYVGYTAFLVFCQR